MKKVQLTVAICSWRSPHLLRPCIASLKKSMTVETQPIFVLNEADRESVEILMDENIEFIRTTRNFGHSAIDLAATLFRGDYFAKANDDMLFQPGWDADLIEIVDSAYPASASSRLVEPRDMGNPAAIVEDLGPFETAHEKFLLRQRTGAYRCTEIIGYNNPILVRTDDYREVGGYSDGMDMHWFPGGHLEDYFAWRLWKLHEENFRMVVSGRSCVYHAMAQSASRIASNEQPPGDQYFQFRTGTTIESFRAKVGINSMIPGRPT